MMRNERRERGFALVTVLWAVAILAVIAGSVTLTTHTEARLARTHRQRAELQAVADAAINLVLLRFASPLAGPHPPIDGTPISVSFAGYDVRVTVQDQAGKIDINQAPGDLLVRILVASGMDGLAADEMTDRIMDWRDRGPNKRLNGAKADDYRMAGYAYGPRNGLFPSIEELQLVLGLPMEVFHRATPLLTTASQNTAVDPDVAPAAVLLLLPTMDEERVRGVLEQREERVGTAHDDANLVQGRNILGRPINIAATVSVDDFVRVRREATLCLTGFLNDPIWIYEWR